MHRQEGSLLDDAISRFSFSASPSPLSPTGANETSKDDLSGNSLHPKKTEPEPTVMKTTPAIAIVFAICTSAHADGLSPLEQLGKALLFDRNLSTPPGQSCADCHAPGTGFTGRDSEINAAGAVYQGAVRNRFGDRKPPSVAYADAPVLQYNEIEQTWFGGSFWDGRATGWILGDPLIEQAMGPFLNPLEQHIPGAKQVVLKVSKSTYAGLFKQVWGPDSLNPRTDAGLNYERVAIAIAAYERSAEVSAFTSKFDHYWRTSLAAGNAPEAIGSGEGEKEVLDPEGILTDQEFSGLVEFGEYCARCHVSTAPGPGGTPPLFTDYSFENIGVPKNPQNPFYTVSPEWNPDGADFVDYGLGGFLKKAGYPEEVYQPELGKFKVPTLRNVDERPYPEFVKAYMHNGVLKSLEEVVHFYNTRDILTENWPAPEVPYNLNTELFEGHKIGDFQLDAEAEAAIVAFLKTLTDGYEPPQD
jgi:cytochrome c peroxidase